MPKKRRKISKRITAKDYRIVARIDLDKKLTKKQLEEYIRSSTKLLNKAYRTMNTASKKDFDVVVRRIGKGRGKNNILGTHMGKKSKGELEKQAKILKSILSGDGTSEVAQAFEDLKVERAYRTFLKSPFGMEGITREEYKDLASVWNKLRDVFDTYGSEQVNTIIADYKDQVSISTIGDIVREKFETGVYNTPKTLTNAIIDEIKSMIK